MEGGWIFINIRATPAGVCLQKRISRLHCKKNKGSKIRTPAASLHVARQRLAAAPRRQARPKGSPSANNVCQGLILKIIKKRLKLKNCQEEGIGYNGRGPEPYMCKYTYVCIVCLLGGRQPNRPRERTSNSQLFSHLATTPHAARAQFNLIICILLISHNFILFFKTK
jgi:hypothetical protein